MTKIKGIHHMGMVMVVVLVLLRAQHAVSVHQASKGEATIDGGKGKHQADSLPKIHIQVDAKEIPDRPQRARAKMELVQNGHPEHLAWPKDWDGSISISLHGHSSKNYPKKQYAIKTSEEVSFGKDWIADSKFVLHAPYADKSLMRNALAYSLAGATGWPSPKTKFVELTINGTYEGLFVLTERITSKRLGLKGSKACLQEMGDSTNTVPSGGYLLTYDHITKRGWKRFFPGSNSAFYVRHPRKNITDDAVAYLEGYLGSALGVEEDKPLTGLLDMGSWTDYFFITELSSNVDAFSFSTYLVKDCQSRLVAGPVWDFNEAFGNCNYGGYADAWCMKTSAPGVSIIKDMLSALLYDANDQDTIEQFREVRRAFAQRWDELRSKGNVFSNDSISQRVNSYRTLLKETGAADRNFKRWKILGKYVWPNPQEVASITSYDGQVDYLLRWIEGRLEWMDEAIGPLRKGNPMGHYHPTTKHSIAYASWFVLMTGLVLISLAGYVLHSRGKEGHRMLHPSQI